MATIVETEIENESELTVLASLEDIKSAAEKVRLKVERTSKDASQLALLATYINEMNFLRGQLRERIAHSSKGEPLDEESVKYFRRANPFEIDGAQVNASLAALGVYAEQQLRSLDKALGREPSERSEELIRKAIMLTASIKAWASYADPRWTPTKIPA